MNDCVGKDKCDWWQKNDYYHGAGEECMWLRKNVLDGPICQCPWWGIKKEIVEAWQHD